MFPYTDIEEPISSTCKKCNDTFLSSLKHGCRYHKVKDGRCVDCHEEEPFTINCYHTRKKSSLFCCFW